MVVLSTGAAMILPAPGFDPLATMEAIQAERVTSIYGVPTMFIAQLQHPEFKRFDFSSLRTGVMAGAPCPIEVMKRVVSDMHCPQMTIMYGQTESSPVITMSSVDDSVERRVSTVGGACANTEVKIVDRASGETVEAGEQGELSMSRARSLTSPPWAALAGQPKSRSHRPRVRRFPSANKANCARAATWS